MLGISKRHVRSDDEGAVQPLGSGTAPFRAMGSFPQNLLPSLNSSSPLPQSSLLQINPPNWKTAGSGKEFIKGKERRAWCLWLPAHLSFQNLVDNSISALGASLGFCVRSRNRRREGGKEGMRPEAGGELSPVQAWGGLVRDSLGRRGMSVAGSSQGRGGEAGGGRCLAERGLAEQVGEMTPRNSSSSSSQGGGGSDCPGASFPKCPPCTEVSITLGTLMFGEGERGCGGGLTFSGRIQPSLT